MTGVVELPVRGGTTVMPGSTFCGLIVPLFLESVLLRFPFCGAICSGGGEGELGGARGAVGLAGEVV